MKKNVKYIFLTVFLFLMFSQNVNAASIFDFCGDQGTQNALFIVAILLFLIKILVPILIIVFGVIDLSKSIMSNKEEAIKESTTSLMIRIISGVIILFLPTFIKAIFNLMYEYTSINSDFEACTNCVFDYTSCTENFDFFSGSLNDGTNATDSGNAPSDILDGNGNGGSGGSGGSSGSNGSGGSGGSSGGSSSGGNSGTGNSGIDPTSTQQQILTSFVFPLGKCTKTTSFGKFGASGHTYGVHKGLDMTNYASGGSMKEGDLIMAVAAGTVTAISKTDSSSSGIYVQIDHGQKVVTRYLHMSKTNVNKGDSIRSGQVIGYAGKTGSTSTVHLHFSLSIDGNYVDPAPYLRKHCSSL